jgi:hypothetical protein
LELTPQIGWRFDPTGIVKQDSRGAGVLWTGPNPATPHRQVYSLSSAFSSQEFIMIDGRLVPEGTGKHPVKDPFRVTVPTADIDWSGFDKALDENGEDVRRVIVPFNASDTNNTRRVLINSPFDDDGRHGRPGCNFGSAASPRITLRWTPMDCLQLTNRYDGVIPNGWSVDADDVGGWPLGFYVDPQKWKNDFVISCEEWNGGNGDVAMDSIHGRIVDVDLDVDANYDGIIDEEDEPLEETQGGLVGGELVPIRLRVLPPGLPGKTTLLATSGGSRIRVWLDPSRNDEVALPKTWNAGETVPSILYVEGIAPSAAMRDIKMTLLYDENPDGQSSPLLKCEDHIVLTVVNVRIEAIAFNYDTSSAITDAINLRENYQCGISAPEFIRGIKNMASAYVRYSRPSILCKFFVQPNEINTIRIKAKSADFNGVLGDIAEKSIVLVDGVSCEGEDNPSTTDFDESQYAFLSIDGTIPGKICKSEESWDWIVTEIDGLLIEGANFVVDRTTNHQVYVILDTPKAPWNQISGDTQNPWCSALDFVIIECDTVGGSV